MGVEVLGRADKFRRRPSSRSCGDRHAGNVAARQDKTTTQRELTNPLKIWLIQMFGNDTRNKNLIHKEIKNSLNMQEACYHLVHNLFLTVI